MVFLLFGWLEGEVIVVKTSCIMMTSGLFEAVRTQIIVDAVVDICKSSCRRARRILFHAAPVVSQVVDSGFHDVEQHLSMNLHFRNIQEQSNCMVTTVT